MTEILYNNSSVSILLRYKRELKNRGMGDEPARYCD